MQVGQVPQVKTEQVRIDMDAQNLTTEPRVDSEVDEAYPEDFDMNSEKRADWEAEMARYREIKLADRWHNLDSSCGEIPHDFTSGISPLSWVLTILIVLAVFVVVLL